MEKRIICPNCFCETEYTLDDLSNSKEDIICPFCDEFLYMEMNNEPSAT